MSARSFEQAFEVRPRPGGGFRARLDGFGGTTLGCATLAVARDLPDLALHALHACFLRPVPTQAPAHLEISELSRGRRFARRRVEIRDEKGRTCLDLVASFAAPQQGPELADPVALDLPPPESLPGDRELARAEGWEVSDEPPWPIELRWCGRPWDLDGPAEHSRYHAWVRPTVSPGSAAGRAAGIAFTSDYHSHWPVARKLGGPFDAMGFTSLDQSVWIHRDLPWDDWWLLTSWTDQAHAGRSLGHRTLRTRDGLLVASMAQEAMIPGARLRD